jgi:signal transduction histidine kinase/tetratricopeptide (TPR) repeat protein
MRKPLLVLLLLTYSVCSIAQEMTSDQLKSQLAAHPQEDTFRVNRLIDLSFSSDWGLSRREECAREALSLSRKIGYPHGEGIALTNLGYFTFRLGDKKTGDSLLRAAQAFATKMDDPELNGVLLYRFGLVILHTNPDKSAIDSLKKAEAAFEKSGSYKRLLDCQSQMVSYYQQYVSNYPMAMEYLLKYIQLSEKLNLSSYYIDGLTNLGALYSFIGDHEKSLETLEKARAEIKRLKVNKGLISQLQNSLGEEYRLSGRYPEAIQAYLLAIENNPILPDYQDESNLADVYLRMDSLRLAFQYGFHSFAIAKQKEDNLIIPWLHGLLARAYLKKGMPDSAIYYAESGLAGAIKEGNIEYMRDNSQALAKAYALKKDFAKAYDYHLRYVNYKDSLLGAEVRNKTAVLQYNNDLEKKQAQIAQLNQQKKAQQNFLISALIVLALILITVVLLLRNNRQKQRANQLLQKQKQEIDDKALQLSVQKDSLQQSYNNVELLGQIGHQISSSLSVEKIIGTVYNNVNALMDANVFGIGIYNETLRRIEFPATYENGQPLPFYTNEIDAENRFAPICFRSGKEIIIGDLNKEYKAYLQQMSTPHEGEQPLSLIFLPLMVKEKKLGVITVQSFNLNAYTDYHLFMLRNIAVYAAIALDNAESYEELNHAMASLKKTQGQLIQSEKMASLGELTAGIAHEIQNPLNFVNNFSEINAELINEMNEGLAAGNFDEVRSIAENIRENEKKILFHGKRADIIVKGMLQHSRGSNSAKELTDINGLCDEYLRLSYHGLRARDNKFNATIESDFDKKISSVQIVPQDIGRVLLNLYNNAFYAVYERKKLSLNGFEPVVSVVTKKTDTGILISVKDNGNGIPQKNIDKIFQPFFTTKPSGQGTGLGLSLSYDIVKAHGGEIVLHTKENQGSEFTITLPA